MMGTDRKPASQADKVVAMPRRIAWREFRARHVPWMVFCVAAGITAWLWQQQWGQCSLSGIGEGIRSTVSSPQTGWIKRLSVRPYEMVKRGDPIIEILPVDSGAELDLLGVELELARLRLQPSLSEQNAVSYERARLEWLQQKTELAMARVNLDRAEKDLRRNTPMRQEKLISEEIYDLSLRDRDMYLAEVTEKSKAVAEVEKRLEKLRAVGVPESTTNQTVSVLLEHLEARHQSARSNLQPFVVRAPIDGMVQYLCRQADEYVVDGEPLAIITSQWCDQVVGYLRQPYPLNPQAGMRVRITTRTRERTTAWAQIDQVGVQVEPITNSLAFLRQGMAIDAGLPVIVQLPGTMRVRPGEVVDLMILPHSVPKTQGASLP